MPPLVLEEYSHSQRAWGDQRMVTGTNTLLNHGIIHSGGNLTSATVQKGRLLLYTWFGSYLYLDHFFEYSQFVNPKKCTDAYNEMDRLRGN